MILCICPNPSVDTFAWIDAVNPGEVNRISREERFPGGKGIHVALAINELEETSQVMAFWGGETGSWIRQQLKAKGIESVGVAVREANRICYTFRSYTPFNGTELLGMGPIISPNEIEQFSLIFERSIQEVEMVCMSGSWPPYAMGAEYEKLIRIAKAADKIVALDCAGEQLINGRQAHPDVIHINQHEGAESLGTTDPALMARRLNNYCKFAAVTAGADGLYMGFKGQVIHATCKVEVISAVGAGDALLGGLAIGIKRGLSLEEIVKLGVGCGAANCINPQLGMIKKEDVMDLFKEVEIDYQEV